jgi:hypothetical protein
MTKPHDPLDIQQRGLPLIRTQKVRGEMDYVMMNPALRVWLEEKAGADSRSHASHGAQLHGLRRPGFDQG